MASKTRKKSKKVRKPRGGRVVAEVAESYGIKLDQKPGDKTLSPNEAGKVLGVTGEAVKQWIYSRKLPSVKMVNGYWKIRVADLEAFIRKREHVASRCVMIAGAEGSRVLDRAKDIEPLGHDVLVAQGLADSLLKALDHYPSLFVVDLTDFEEGWTFAERIRESRNIRNTHILFLTESTLKENDINRALSLGIQGCLANDADGEALRREVQKLLDEPR